MKNMVSTEKKKHFSFIGKAKRNTEGNLSFSNPPRKQYGRDREGQKETETKRGIETTHPFPSAPS